MSTQFKFFSIPVNLESKAEAELNEFLRTIRLVNIHKQLICQDDRFYWAIAAEFVADNTKSDKSDFSPKKKIDYREVLSEDDFAIYAKLRDWRKETAAKESKQLYNVFLNEHLATMVEKRITSKEALSGIDGVGEARVEKYGDAVIRILKEEFEKLEKKDEKSKKPLPPDSELRQS